MHFPEGAATLGQMVAITPFHLMAALVLLLNFGVAPAEAKDRGIARLEKSLKSPAKAMVRSLKGKVAIADFSSAGDPFLSSEFGQAVAESLTALLLRYRRADFSVIDRRELMKVLQDSAVFGESGAMERAIAGGAGADILVSGTYQVALSRVLLHIKATDTRRSTLIDSKTVDLALTPDLSRMLEHAFRSMGSEPSAPTGAVQPGLGGVPELLSVDVGIFYEGGNGKLYPIREGMVLTSRDNYAIHISAPQDCFVYVYQADTVGRTTRLFPNPDFSEVKNPIVAGASLWVPGGARLLFLDDHPGKEEIYVFATRSATAGLEGITKANLTDISRVIHTMGVGGARERPVVAKLADGKRTAMEGVIRRLAASGDFYFRVGFFHRE